MSSKKDDIPSNAEIINELTEGLEKSLMPDPSASDEADSNVEQIRTDDLSDETLLEKHLLEEHETQEGNGDIYKQASDSTEEVIEDEEFRNEMEEKLTDEEKEVCLTFRVQELIMEVRTKIDFTVKGNMNI